MFRFTAMATRFAIIGAGRGEGIGVGTLREPIVEVNGARWSPVGNMEGTGMYIVAHQRLVALPLPSRPPRPLPQPTDETNATRRVGHRRRLTNYLRTYEPVPRTQCSRICLACGRRLVRMEAVKVEKASLASISSHNPGQPDRLDRRQGRIGKASTGRSTIGRTGLARAHPGHRPASGGSRDRRRSGAAALLSPSQSWLPQSGCPGHDSGVSSYPSHAAWLASSWLVPASWSLPSFRLHFLSSPFNRLVPDAES